MAAGRTLWVLRHAKTKRDPPAGAGDHGRNLAPRGRRDADALGGRIGDRGDRFGLDPALLPALVLCSTAARTVETTERVLAQMADPPPVTYLPVLYGGTPKDVLKQVAAVDDTIASVMVVGHNPTFEALVEALPERPDPMLSGGFATCGLAVFSLPIEHWNDVVPRTAGVLGVFVPPF